MGDEGSDDRVGRLKARVAELRLASKLGLSTMRGALLPGLGVYHAASWDNDEGGVCIWYHAPDRSTRMVPLSRLEIVLGVSVMDDQGRVRRASARSMVSRVASREAHVETHIDTEGDIAVISIGRVQEDEYTAYSESRAAPVREGAPMDVRAEEE